MANRMPRLVTYSMCMLVNATSPKLSYALQWPSRGMRVSHKGWVTFARISNG